MIEKFKNPYSLLLISWISLIVIALITSNGLISATAIFYTGLLPFIGIVLWFAYSELGQTIRSHLKKWHVTIIFSWFIFGYAVYSQKWAAALLNEIFYIDASNLGVSYTLLAFLFTPFGILYQESVIASLRNTILVVGMIWGGIFPLLLFLPIPVKKLLIALGVSFFIISLSSFFVSSVANVVLRKEFLVKEFALWADFNSNHLCTDKWAKDAESVIFLGGNRVLIYDPKKSLNKQFSSETCDFEKSF